MLFPIYIRFGVIFLSHGYFIKLHKTFVLILVAPGPGTPEALCATSFALIFFRIYAKVISTTWASDFNCNFLISFLLSW